MKFKKVRKKHSCHTPNGVRLLALGFAGGTAAGRQKVAASALPHRNNIQKKKSKLS